ncbi:MAG: cytochrome c oxidase assembly protein [Chloroflexi bacterium]|nr:cytochrome c oxidase assembly protein [Chloroflexota bacterium]
MHKWSIVFLTLACLLASGPPVLAHEGGIVMPTDVWQHWNADPLLALGLLATVFLYSRGMSTLWRRAGRGRGVSQGASIAFMAGLAVLFAALLTPLHPLGETLFMAHMVQHLLILVIAAPLLAVGSPAFVLLWALPVSWRRSIGRLGTRPPVRRAFAVLSAPLLSAIVHAGVIWLWHVPALYESAFVNESLHALEHVLFLGTGLLYWHGIVHARRAQAGLNILSLFAMMMATGLLGAALSLAGSAWYPTHIARAPLWSLTPLQDQQIAGGIMWVPMSTVYLLAAALQIVLLLGQEEVTVREARLSEQEGSPHGVP